MRPLPTAELASSTSPNPRILHAIPDPLPVVLTQDHPLDKVGRMRLATSSLRSFPTVALRGVLEPGSDPFLDDDEWNKVTKRERALKSEAPRLVPLNALPVSAYKNPWMIHSVGDLFRVYLPEISIAAGMVIVSGVLAGQVIRHFFHFVEMEWVMWTYSSLYLLYAGALYFGARGKLFADSKREFRTMLLISMILVIPHALASAIVSAAA